MNQGLWQGLRPRTRRLIRAIALWCVAGLLATGWGVMTAQYTGSVGPHEAHYSVTLNNEVTFDMGPLGSLILDSPMPLNLGVDVHVGQIPEDLTTEESGREGPDGAVEALTADLASYTQFFTGPADAVASAARGLAADALARTVLMWSLLLTSVLLGRLAAHGVLRAAARSALARPGVAPVLAVLTAAALAVALVPAMQGSSGAGRTSVVLQGTPLQDARITGRLGALIDHYGQFVVEEIEKNNEFYRRVGANLEEVLEADGSRLAPAGPPLAMPTVAPTTPAEAEGPAPRSAGDPVTMVVVSDLHCNTGMAQIAGNIAERVGADMILNLGDDVIGGTAVEGYCIDSFAASFGDRPVVVAGGNHDSQETAGQARANGWHVLDGEVVEVHGVRFLGDTDPTLTSLGAPTRLVAEENHAQRGHRLTTTACEERRAGNPVDILMMHNHRATEEALDSGCVHYALAGHFHRRIGPWQRGLGVQYVHTSSAGAIANEPTIGPVSGPAGVSILIWDRQASAPFALRVVRVMPDTSVELSPWYAWPRPPAEPVHLDWPTPEESPWP